MIWYNMPKWFDCFVKLGVDESQTQWSTIASLYHKTGSNKQCRMLGSSAKLQVREENKNQRKSGKQEQKERKLLDMGKPWKWRKEKREKQENFERKSSLSIHKLSHLKKRKWNQILFFQHQIKLLFLNMKN